MILVGNVTLHGLEADATFGQWDYANRSPRPVGLPANVSDDLNCCRFSLYSIPRNPPLPRAFPAPTTSDQFDLRNQADANPYIIQIGSRQVMQVNAASLEHDTSYNSKPSIIMTLGAHKGNTLREIHAFKPCYIEWLSKQQYIKKHSKIFLKKQKI